MNPLNYASLEASKRLVEAGIVLETERVRILQHFPQRIPEWVLAPKCSYTIGPEVIPAPSMAEVWRELPDSCYFAKYMGHYQAWREWVTFEGHGASSPVQENTNPTDALIDLLIWTRKEKQ